MDAQFFIKRDHGVIPREMQVKQLRILSIFIFILFIVPSLVAQNASQAYLDELKNIKKISGNNKVARELHLKAMDNHKKKMYSDSEKLWYRAAKADPGWVEPFFNLACSTALQGKQEISFEYLEMALNMDKTKVIPWVKNDPDIASLRKYKKYSQLLERYSEKTISLSDAVIILRESLSGKNLNRFKSLIHNGTGLKLDTHGEKNVDGLIDRNKITGDVLNMIISEMYEGGDFSEMPDMSENEPGVKVFYIQTHYHQDPPGSPMRCESWRDNLYHFKNINGSWFLIKIESSGNGGC